MKNLFNYLRYAKGLVAALAIAVLVALPAVVNADFSPARPVKDYNNLSDRAGFDHVTFNSFINVPGYGDERYFFDGKNAANTAEGGFQDAVPVENANEVLMRVYVHNGASTASNSVDANGDGHMDGIARNTRVRVTLPTTTANYMQATASISADNANPGTVSDTLGFQAPGNFSLEYVPGSASIRTNAGTFALDNSIVTSGAPIGYNAINGNVPGCFEFGGLVTLKVKVNKPNLSIVKRVRKAGETTWSQENSAKPGDTLEYQINVTNTGTSELRNLRIRDVLPVHMSYVPGSTIIRTAAHPNGVPAGNDNVATQTGIDVGHYAPNANVLVQFKAKVDDAAKLQCGDYTLRNTAIAKPEGMNEFQNIANTKVSKVCAPATTPTPAQPKPTALPNTGVGSALAGIFGSGSLGVAIRGYLATRRKLSASLLDV